MQHTRLKEQAMRLTQPLYEGDGYVHADYAARRESQTDAIAIERAARQLRAATLAALVERFFDWLDRGARNARRRRLEQYLARSTDAADLEHRMRELERRGELLG
jgi:hypothetical protein